MRSALRATSLVAAGALLYALGARGFHHRHFDVFLALVLGLAALIVVVVVAMSTRPPEKG
jgi:hypothetical protein